MRRLLHRLEAELKLPIYLISDNDTWSYFYFSSLKRGTLDPQAECQFTALKKPRYLGITTRDWSDVKHLDCTRPWKPHWKLRLKAMQEYQCFRSQAWQEELKQFEMNKRPIMLDALFMQLRSTAFCQWIQDKLKRRQWLA